VKEFVASRVRNTSMNKPFFNKDIKPAILNAMTQAKREISIAVAWMSDQDIIERLLQKSNEGIAVTIILSSEAREEIVKSIESRSNGSIRVYILTKVGKSMMHHKFCVIDKKVLITGSYNYTHNAISNDENVVVIESEEVAKFFVEEYSKLLSQFQIQPPLGQVEPKRFKWNILKGVVATKADVGMGYIEGKSYTIFVANVDLESNAGKKYAKGDFFAIEEEEPLPI
jgi:phosphatidylserine/phosphatidylglycerophosphate/cardiolipin synthase-like enzyme